MRDRPLLGAAVRNGEITVRQAQTVLPVAGLLGETAATLTEAFELALELRIVHHLDHLAAGEPVDDLLDPAAMTPLTRSYLRDVFRAVSTVAGELRP